MGKGTFRAKQLARMSTGGSSSKPRRVQLAFPRRQTTALQRTEWLDNTEEEDMGIKELGKNMRAFSLKRAPTSWVLSVTRRIGVRGYFGVFSGACILYRVGVPVPIGSRARDRAAGLYMECAAGTRQPSALRSASRLVHRILSGTPQGQTQLGTLQSAADNASISTDTLEGSTSFEDGLSRR